MRKPVCIECKHRHLGAGAPCRFCGNTSGSANFCLAGLPDDVPPESLDEMKVHPVRGTIIGPKKRLCYKKNRNGKCRDFNPLVDR